MDHGLCEGLKDLLLFLIKEESLNKEFTTEDFKEAAHTVIREQRYDDCTESVLDFLLDVTVGIRDITTMLNHVTFYMSEIRRDSWKNGHFKVVDRREPLWWV